MLRGLVLTAVTSLACVMLAGQDRDRRSLQVFEVDPPHPDVPVWLEIAASPDQPGTLLVCGMRVATGPPRRSYGFVARTDDAGRTWRRTLTVDDAPFVSEGTCAMGAGNRAYYIAQPGDGQRASAARLRYYRSLDGGRTWLPPTERPFADMTTMAVRPDAPAQGGRVFVVANGFHRDASGRRRHTMDLFTAATDDAELTGPVRYDGAVEYGDTFPGGVRMLADGEAVAVYSTAHVPADAAMPPDRYPRFIEVVRTRARGQAWATPVVVASVDRWGLPDTPTLTVSPRGAPETVLVAWTAYAEGRSSVFLARSEDAGRTWSAPQRVDDTTAGLPEARDVVAHPNLAANARGQVTLTWFDLQRKCWRVRTGRVTGAWDGPSRPLTACGVPSPPNQGDYGTQRQWETGLAVDGSGAFWPVWMETGASGARIVTTRLATRE